MNDSESLNEHEVLKSDVDLTNAIPIPIIAAGFSGSAPGLPGADVDGDKAVGLIEAIFAVESVAGADR